jgi:hypothetical protein
MYASIHTILACRNKETFKNFSRNGPSHESADSHKKFSRHITGDREFASGSEGPDRGGDTTGTAVIAFHAQ